MTYEFSWLLFLSFYYYYYFTCGCGYLIPCLALSVRTTLIPQYEVQFPTADSVHSHTFISNDFFFSFFFLLLIFFSFDQSRTIFQQMPAVSSLFPPFSFVTSFTGSESFLPLLLSYRLYSLWFSSLLPFFSLLSTLCQYSGIRPGYHPTSPYYP